jgi:signal peptidase I
MEGTIVIFSKKRKARKSAHEVLRHAHHVRHMREDILSVEELSQLDLAEADLRAAIKGDDIARMESDAESLAHVVQRIAPPHRGGGLRENFEVLVVAISVAMALRAYFIQPFKIPTGSMQPTLYGIHSVEKEAPGITDHYPLKIAKFVITGEWYDERRAKADGVLGAPKDHPVDPSVRVYRIGGKAHKIPKDAVDSRFLGRYELRFHVGDAVKKGDLLWSGIVTRGDHVFVNKVAWNFRKPRRGEIMVFNTKDIKGLPTGTHYIKRMCGLPNERVAIHPPNLVIDRDVVRDPETIAKVASCDAGYHGYQLDGLLSSRELEWPMLDGQYFALGDNTRNSRDSRYWGPVPEVNLVGPAAIVYWPISSRWGFAR